MKKQAVIFVFIFISITSLSQFNFKRKDSIIVMNQNDTLKFAWAGGFNNPQFSNIDLNLDGIKDIFVFDRSSNEVRTFVYEEINDSLTLVYRPEYEKKFPREVMEYRVTLVDYNCDGKEDLWTHAFGGLKVYKNISDTIEGLKWELAYPFLQSFHHTSNSQVYSRSSDIPAIVDIDGDGDVDILSFGVSGQTIQYHKNMAMETNENCDTMIFELKNECWGKIKENGTSNIISVNDNTSPCNGQFNVTDPLSIGLRHVGGTILALDLDGSGVMDIVMGDATYPNLISLTNSGTSVNSNSALENLNYTFPIHNPVNIPSFPAAYYLDLDNDGIKDLIASPNARNLSNNVKSAWWYKNKGTNTNPNLIFKSKNYLQKEMIDVGSGAIPVFFDYNNDSLEDLIISNTYNFVSIDSNQSKFSLFENVGTTQQPVYKLVNNNYLNLPNKNLGIRLFPAFGDIDKDGDCDLFVGTQFGTIYFFENFQHNNEAQFSTNPILVNNNNNNKIDVGSYAAPTLFDIDKNGNLDLIVGNKLGKLYFYKNIGFKNKFELKNENLGNVNVAVTNSNGYAQPNFFNINDTIHLLLGAGDGYIHYYTNIDNKLNTGNSFSLKSHTFLDIKNGTFSSLAIKDINKDNKLDLFIGNNLGGIAHYQGDYFKNTSSINKLTYENFNIHIFPNPSKNFFNFNLTDKDFSTLKGKQFYIYTSDGKLILNQTIYSKNNTFELNNKGIFFLKIENFSNLKKLIVY